MKGKNLFRKVFTGTNVTKDETKDETLTLAAVSFTNNEVVSVGAHRCEIFLTVGSGFMLVDTETGKQFSELDMNTAPGIYQPKQTKIFVCPEKTQWAFGASPEVNLDDVLYGIRAFYGKDVHPDLYADITERIMMALPPSATDHLIVPARQQQSLDDIFTQRRNKP